MHACSRSATSGDGGIVVSFASSLRISSASARGRAVSAVRPGDVSTSLTVAHTPEASVARSERSDTMRSVLPLDAILFDMGGTLDGRGAWRGRSRRLFLDLGVGHFS